MLKELFKGSVIYGIAPFVPKILTVLLLPILTKYLTSTDYGVIGTITSITFAVQALQDLGLRPLLANHFYKCKYQYKVIWREIYGEEGDQVLDSRRDHRPGRDVLLVRGQICHERDDQNRG